MRRSWDRFPPYVSVAEKAARAERKRRQLEKKGQQLDPVCLNGRAIARSWWGQAWCRNLESYADYSNRIGRGRSYLRCGAVLDLKIEETRVTALVQGSRSQPYKVAIRIAALAKTAWERIRSDCAGKIDSLQALLAGEFPQDLAALFAVQKRGLFPAPAEIKFDCSCPDWASMCKHVAAALYGVGARLDRAPELFFVLRGVSVEELVGGAVKATARRFIDQRPVDGAQVIAEDRLSDLFGINFGAGEPAPEETAAPAPEPKQKTRKKRATEKATTPGRRASGKAKSSPTKSKAGDKTAKPAKRAPRVEAPAERILKLVQASRKGIDVPAIQKRTGIDVVKIRNTIFAALRKGLIQRVARGVYKGI